MQSLARLMHIGIIRDDGSLQQFGTTLVLLLCSYTQEEQGRLSSNPVLLLVGTEYRIRKQPINERPKHNFRLTAPTSDKHPTLLDYYN